MVDNGFSDSVGFCFCAIKAGAYVGGGEASLARTYCPGPDVLSRVACRVRENMFFIKGSSDLFRKIFGSDLSSFVVFASRHVPRYWCYSDAGMVFAGNG